MESIEEGNVGLEKEWKRREYLFPFPLKPRTTNYNFFQLLEIFPESKSTIRQWLKDEIDQCKADLNEALGLERLWSIALALEPDWKERERWKKVINNTLIEPLRRGRESKIRSNGFYLSFLSGTRSVRKGLDESDIRRAKEVPIADVFPGELRKQGKLLSGICPFHEERTGSFKVFTDKNRWYCFGACATGGDVIEFMRKLYNLSFIEAVKKLTVCP